jgi:hypothetical protein
MLVNSNTEMSEGLKITKVFGTDYMGRRGRRVKISDNDVIPSRGFYLKC